VRAARRDAVWALVVLASWMASACGTDVVQLQSASRQPKPACVSIPQGGGILCLYCGADYSQQRACLKCESTASASSCATCFWSDSVDGGTCQQCVDSSGNLSTVGCNELRADLLTPIPSP
jgi:hypothetical protein